MKQKNNNSLTVWCMMGLPASGKSIYVDTHLTQFVKISQDDIRRIFYGNQFYPNAEGYVKCDARNIARLILSQNKSIVLDNTAILPMYRREAKLLAKEYNAKFTLVFIDTPADVCLERNRKRPEDKRVPDEVIQNMAIQIMPPTRLTRAGKKSEWWDFGEKINVIYVPYKEKV